MGLAEKRAQQLKQRFLHQAKLEHYTPSLDIDFISFLKEKVIPGLRPSSVTSYRSATRKVVTTPEAIELVSTLKPEVDRAISKRTTSKRKKALSNDDLALLELYAEKQEAADKRTVYGKATTLWLRAGLLTGLRPNEWLTARISGDYDMLVENTKLKQCVAKDWPTRTVKLEHLSSEEWETINTFMEVIRHMKNRDVNRTTANNFAAFRTACGMWLNKANSRLFPRRKENITLMSARHQFIANLKSSGSYSPKEIAYLVGHANDLRAFETYGRTSNGNKDIFLPAIPDEAEELMTRITSKLEKKISKRAELRNLIERAQKNQSKLSGENT